MVAANPPWVDGVNGGTPLSATRLNRIEARIEERINADDAASVLGSSALQTSLVATEVSSYVTSKGDFASAASEAADARLERILPVGSFSNWTGAQSLNAAAVSKSDWLKRTLTGNTTLSLAAGKTGRAYTLTLELAQDATGGRTFTALGVKWPYALAPVITPTPGAKDVLHLSWTGVEWVGSIAAQSLAAPA